MPTRHLRTVFHKLHNFSWYVILTVLCINSLTGFNLCAALSPWIYAQLFKLHEICMTCWIFVHNILTISLQWLNLWPNSLIMCICKTQWIFVTAYLLSYIYCNHYVTSPIFDFLILKLKHHNIFAAHVAEVIIEDPTIAWALKSDV